MVASSLEQVEAGRELRPILRGGVGGGQARCRRTGMRLLGLN
jgi:hypothetical protein